VWEGIIKMDLKEVGRGLGMDSLGFGVRLLMNTAKNLRGS
jgi:hypothetical protein